MGAEDLADRVTAGCRLAREARETADALAERAPVPDGQPARQHRIPAQQQSPRPVEQHDVIVEVAGRREDVDRPVAEIQRCHARRPPLDPEEVGDVRGADRGDGAAGEVGELHVAGVMIPVAVRVGDGERDPLPSMSSSTVRRIGKSSASAVAPVSWRSARSAPSRRTRNGASKLTHLLCRITNVSSSSRHDLERRVGRSLAVEGAVDPSHRTEIGRVRHDVRVGPPPCRSARGEVRPRACRPSRPARSDRRAWRSRTGRRRPPPRRRSSRERGSRGHRPDP